MRVTLDTNFLVSATQWKNSECYKLLRRFIEKEVMIYITVEILMEFSKVLRRDFGADDTEISNRFAEFLEIMELIRPKKKIEVVKEDPSDNIIIECADESKSDYIITYDKKI